MFRLCRHVLPFALLIAALALVTSACRAILDSPAANLPQPAELHPIPAPSRAVVTSAARRAAIPDLAASPPAAALAAVEVARTRPRRRVLETGIASWYGPGFAGRPTANGELYDPSAMTAAHPELPLGTEVVVVNLANGREVRLRINDRGPYIGNRVIDVSKAAARLLGFYYTGLAEVRVEVIEPAEVTATRAGA